MSRHRRPRVRSALLSAVTVAIAALYVVVPSGAQFLIAGRENQAPTVSARVAPPAVDPAAIRTAAAALRAVPVAERDHPPVILAYHDVAPESTSRYTMPPSAFAAQMAVLAAAGYRTITTDELLGWLGGAPLPPRSVMLTFDDGTGGVWRHADPVLAAHGFAATAFVISGSVREQSGYSMSWDELRRLAASGRWEIAGHTHRGHTDVRVDSAGARGPYLTNRVWLEDAGRLETPEEYRARVTGDFAAAAAAFTGNGLPAPRLFAYPFSAVDRPTNDRAVPRMLRDAVGRAYRASMVNEFGGGTTTPADVAAGELRRLELDAGTTLSTFVRTIAGGTPLPRDGRRLTTAGAWVDPDGRRAGRATVAAGQVVLRPRTGRPAGLRFAPEQTRWWADYALTARGSGLGADGSPAGATIQVLAGTPDQLAVGLSRGWLSVRHGSGRAVRLLVDRPIPAAGAHTVTVSVTGDRRARVVVDGVVRLSQRLPDRAAAPGPAAGGIGFAADRRSGSPEPVVFDRITLTRQR